CDTCATDCGQCAVTVTPPEGDVFEVCAGQMLFLTFYGSTILGGNLYWSSSEGSMTGFEGGAWFVYDSELPGLVPVTVIGYDALGRWQSFDFDIFVIPWWSCY
ncbi:MAG: hypothetical protein V2A73_04305, partial [Pseudomonadota bacterium]